jgi:transcriptional regulator with XRE-family HTH domain
MIDSAWFYQQLEKEGLSLRGMARALGLDPSAASRMLRGERKMSAEEQDGIAAYLGVSLPEVAARRRGEAGGFAEKGQDAYQPEPSRKMDGDLPDGVMTSKDDEAGISFYERVRGCMKGTVTIMPGTDLTAPADPEWAKVYDDD